MWYVVYQVSDGAYKGGTAGVNNVPDQETLDARGFAVKELANHPDTGWGWNPATLAFDIAPPPVVHTWTAKEFLLLFKMSEYMDINAKREIDPIVNYFFAMTEASDVLRSDHPSVVQGIAYLVEFGDLAPERGEAILNNEGYV